MQNPDKEQHSWAKLILILSFLSFFMLLSVLGEEQDINMDMDNPQTILILKLLQGISAVLIFVVPAFLFANYWTKKKIHYLGIFDLPKPITLFLAVSAMLLALPLINFLAEINKHMQLPPVLSGVERWMQDSEAKAEVLTEAFTKGSGIGVLLVNIIVIALIAAIAEEMFFRGLLQKIMHECFGNYHVAVWSAAFIFSAFHMQFYGFLPRMLMGAYLGYVFYWSGSLWVSIAAHFANNAMAVFAIWLANKGAISTDIDEVGTQWEQWFYLLVSIVMVVTGMILIYKKEKDAAGSL